MATFISDTAATARESARATDGRFGPQAHSAPSVSLPVVEDDGPGRTQARSAPSVSLPRVDDDGPGQTQAHSAPLRHEYVSLKDTNVAIRKDLAAAFPGVKFSVRTDGNCSNVAWTDGPPEDAVKEHVARYEAEHFDGMTDMGTPLYERAVDEDGNPFIRHWGSRFVFPRRDLSAETRAAAAARVDDMLERDGQTPSDDQWERYPVPGEMYVLQDRQPRNRRTAGIRYETMNRAEMISIVSVWEADDAYRAANALETCQLCGEDVTATHEGVCEACFQDTHCTECGARLDGASFDGMCDPCAAKYTCPDCGTYTENGSLCLNCRP